MRKESANNAEMFLERQIVTAMATSTDYLLQTAHLFTNPRYFLSHSAREISKWILDYFKEYNQAPNAHLMSIYANKVNDGLITEERALDIEDILNGLSEAYDEKSFNLNYTVDQTKRYISKREIAVLLEDAQGLLLTGKPNDAREMVLGFNSTASDLPTICNPFKSPGILKRAFQQRAAPLIKFPGDLGKFLNSQFVPGGFVVYTAPEKKGKCLPGDQRILLASGEYVTIYEAMQSDLRDIISFDEKEKKFIKTKIAKFWENGPKPVYKVVTKTGRCVEVTKNHPFLTPEGWKDLFEIGAGAFIGVPSTPVLHSTQPSEEKANTVLGSWVFWDMIESVECVGEKDTFDLTVEEHHNFIAQDILVHNTFWLMEHVMQCVRNHKNVMFFQAGDMTVDQQILRFAVYLSKRNYDPEYCAESWIPTMDCLLNQNDSCDLPQRQCDHAVFPGDSGSDKSIDDLIKAATEFENYKPCDIYNCSNCIPTMFVKKAPATPVLTQAHAQRAFDKFHARFPNRLKMSTHPNESLSVKIIEQELDALEKTEGWIPEVIVIDYMDLLTNDPDTSRNADERSKTNQKWKRIRKLANERHMLVISATQAAATSYDKKTIDLKDFSEDKRKNAHVTAMYGINQTDVEKALGIMRLNEMLKRDGKTTPNKQVKVMQALHMGRPFLGAYF